MYTGIWGAETLLPLSWYQELLAQVWLPHKLTTEAIRNAQDRSEIEEAGRGDQQGYGFRKHSVSHSSGQSFCWHQSNHSPDSGEFKSCIILYIYMITLSYISPPPPPRVLILLLYNHIIPCSLVTCITGLATKWDMTISRAGQKSSALQLPLLLTSEMLRTVWLRLPNSNRSSQQHILKPKSVPDLTIRTSKVAATVSLYFFYPVLIISLNECKLM